MQLCKQKKCVGELISFRRSQPRRHAPIIYENTTIRVVAKRIRNVTSRDAPNGWVVPSW